MQIVATKPQANSHPSDELLGFEEGHNLICELRQKALYTNKQEMQRHVVKKGCRRRTNRGLSDKPVCFQSDLKSMRLPAATMVSTTQNGTLSYLYVIESRKVHRR